MAALCARRGSPVHTQPQARVFPGLFALGEGMAGHRQTFVLGAWGGTTFWPPGLREATHPRGSPRGELDGGGGENGRFHLGEGGWPHALSAWDGVSHGSADSEWEPRLDQLWGRPGVARRVCTATVRPSRGRCPVEVAPRLRAPAPRRRCCRRAGLGRGHPLRSPRAFALPLRVRRLEPGRERGKGWRWRGEAEGRILPGG